MPVLDVTVNPSGAVTGCRQVDKAIDGVRAKARTLEDQLGSLKRLFATAFVGYGIARLAKSFLSAAVEAENYRTRLRAVIGDVKEADALYEKIAKWAAINPIDTDEAIASFVLLKSAAVQNTEGALAAIADLSTVMGRDMREVSAAVVSTETESLRRLGILVDKTGKQAIVQSGNVRIAVNKDVDSIRQGIITVLQRNFPGAMQSAGNTWTGVINTMGGMWVEFERDIMGSSGSGGPFESLLAIVRRLRDAWGDWVGSDEYKTFVRDVQSSATSAIETLAELGKTIGSLFRLAAENIDKVISGLKALATYKISSSLLALAGVSNPVAMGIAATTSALVLLQDSADSRNAARGVREIREEIEKLQVAINKAAESGTVVQIQALAAMRAKVAELKTELSHAVTDSIELSRLGWLKQNNSANATSAGKDKTPKPKQTGGKSAAEILVENIQGKIKYLYSDGMSFLPVLDKWASKLKPLSTDWQKIVDLQREIRSDSARKIADETAIAIKASDTATAYALQLAESKSVGTELERQQTALEAIQRSLSDDQWGNAQGFLPDKQYLQSLVDQFNALKSAINPALDASNFRNWTPEMKSLYESIISVQKAFANLSLDALKSQFDAGHISIEQYRQGLEGVKNQFTQYPAVVAQIDLAIKGLDNSISLSMKTLQTFVNEAETALSDKLAAVPDELSGAFAGAIAYSNDLGEALQQLARDIAYTFLKAVLLKSIFGFLGIGGSSVGSGLSGGVSDVWNSAPAGSLSRATSSASSSGAAATAGTKSGDVYNITMNVQAIDTQSFQKALESQKATIASVVVNNIRNNGPVRKAIQGA